MRRLTILTALLTGAFAISACTNGGRESSSNTGPEKSSLPSPGGNANSGTATTNVANTSNANTASMQDNFWANAARGGMAEVELSKVAQSKATNPEVKKFADMMVADHTKANAELKAAAAKQNVILPTDLSGAHRSLLTDLNEAAGADFDRTYVDAMVDAHETDVQLFEDQAEDDDNPDAKAFAAKTLPTLKKHLEMIKGIQSRLQ